MNKEESNTKNLIGSHLLGRFIPDFSFSKTLEFASIGYILLTILGLSNQYIFYSHYNLEITNYLEYSEIIFIIFDDVFSLTFKILLGVIIAGVVVMGIVIAVIILIFIIGFIIFLLEIWFDTWVGRWSEKIDMSSEETNNKIIHLLVPFITITSLLTFLWIINFFDSFNTIKFPLFIGWTYMMSTTNNLLQVRKMYLLLTAGLSVLFFTVIAPINQWEIIGNSNENVKIEMRKGDIYSTDSTLKLLGITKNFTFLYNEKIKETMVLKRSDIYITKVTIR